MSPESIKRLNDLACHNEHAFVYVLSLLQAVSKKRRLDDGTAAVGEAGLDASGSQGGGGGGAHGSVDMTRLCEEILMEAHVRGKGKQAEALHNVLTGANKHPEAARAVSAMVCSAKSNVSDINKLYTLYTAPNVSARPPPRLLQHPGMLQLLVDAVFDHKVKITPQGAAKYHWLLAYATCSRVDGAVGLEDSYQFRKVLEHIEQV